MVLISNAPEGFKRLSTLKKAQKYVRQGRATVERCDAKGRIAIIRFNESHHACRSSERESLKILHARITGDKYDTATRSGQLNQRQAQGIPFVGPLYKLGLVAQPS